MLINQRALFCIFLLCWDSIWVEKEKVFKAHYLCIYFARNWLFGSENILRYWNNKLSMYFILCRHNISKLVCLFVLRFYGPVNPMRSCWVQSVYLATRLLGRLSPLSGQPVLCTFFCQKLTTACPSWISGRERKTIKNISWSISTNKCCRPRRGLNPWPPGLQSDGALTEPRSKLVKILCFFLCFFFLLFYFLWKFW